MNEKKYMNGNGKIKDTKINGFPEWLSFFE